jgi:hypothetical protein
MTLVRPREHSAVCSAFTCPPASTCILSDSAERHDDAHLAAPVPCHISCARAELLDRVDLPNLASLAGDGDPHAGE